LFFPKYGQANENVINLKKKPGKSLESLYPAADPAAIDLLKKMLMFNPSKRCTAEEALEHEFLKPVRRKEMEVRNVGMKVDLAFTPCILLNRTHPLILSH
jgi:serine/threonine protein kinase